jgi:hypothetical protein
VRTYRVSIETEHGTVMLQMSMRQAMLFITELSEVRNNPFLSDLITETCTVTVEG